MSAVADDLGVRGQVVLEGLDRCLRLPLLHEGEQRVQEDDRDDRRGKDRDAARHREQRGDGQQQRERVGELACELARPAPRAPTDELVAPVLEETAFGLALREPLGAAVEIPQQHFPRLARIDRGRDGLRGNGGHACERASAEP